MKVLYLRGDRRFTRALLEILREEHHGYRFADTWEDLFALLAASPYDLAIAYMARPSVADERRCLALAAERPGVMEIFAITDDADLKANLEEAASGIFKCAPLNITKEQLRQAIRAAGVSLAVQAGESRAGIWEEIASGLRLRRGTMHWTVAHGAHFIDLAPREAEVLETLLGAQGEPITASTVARRHYGDSSLLSASALRGIVKSLRHKLEADPAKPRHLLTIYGNGYLWRGEARTLSAKLHR